MDPLLRIKRLIVRGQVRFTEKARLELERDDLAPEDALEAILTAPAIQKTIRSRSPARHSPAERLYIIVGVTYAGLAVYTKGTIRREEGTDILYILVSSKRNVQ